MRCANCGADVVGQYCHVCGQQVIGADDLAIASMVRHFADDVFHLDFKTLRSLAALFKPGFLTAEYLAGRRRRYLSPLKLYVVAAAIFFLVAPLVGFSMFDMLQADPSGAMKALIAERARERSMELALFAERFDLRIQTVVTLSYVISIFVAAFLLKAMFPRWLLAAHLVFALHYVSFLYLAALVLAAAQQWFDLTSPALTIPMTYAMVMPYLFVGLRRVYQQPAASTFAKLLVLCLVTFFVDNAVSLGALLLTLRLV